MIFRFLRGPACDPFCPTLQTVATQVPTMCMLHASGPETSSKTFVENNKKFILCFLFFFFLNLPFYCPSFFFPICHLHFIKTRIACCVSSYYIPLKSFLFGCNPIKGEAKKHKQTPKSCPVTLIYFLSSSSAVIENLFKHIF